jgi:hypothetical protein
LNTSLFDDLPQAEPARSVAMGKALDEPEQSPRPAGIMVPVPPSANALWTFFRGRAQKSATYKKWLKECCIEHRDIKDQTVDFPVEVVITLRLGKGYISTRDIDNCIKPTLDLLKPTSRKRNGDLDHEGLGLIKDDKVEFVRGIRIVVLPPHDSKSEAEFYIDMVPSAVSITPPPRVRTARSKKK